MATAAAGIPVYGSMIPIGGDVTEQRDPKGDERFRELYGHNPDARLDEIGSWINDLYHEQDAHMWARFHEWSYNIQFASGRQWLATTDGRSWFEPPPPSGTVRVTNNLTWRAGEYRVSKLTESRPIGKIIPHSNEVIDSDRAEAAQQLVGHLDRVLDFGLVYDEALWYDWLCGCAFIEVGWESATGQVVVAKRARVTLDEMGQPIEEEYFVNADGEEVDEANAATYQLGEVDPRVIPPWGVRVSDPQEVDLRKQRWITIANVMEVSEIKRRFGDKADNIAGGDQYDQFVYHQDLISGWSYDGQRRRPSDKQYVSRSLVIRYFERPSEAFPRGRYIVVCESKVLAYELELPYGDDDIGYKFPLVQLRTGHHPKDFYGKPGVQPLIPIQKRINQLESHAIEYIRLFSKGGIAAEYGTLIEESWNDNYGSVLYYQGDRPQPLSWPGMPSDVWQALERAYENFDRISGWADVARGDVPPGVKAAKAILELKRSNDTPLGKGLQRLDRCVEEVTQLLIERARWGYSEPRLIQVIGLDAPHLVKAISSDDLPLAFSVKIETDSLLRLSYPAKLELLFELADRNWIDKNAAMRLLNFSDWEHHSGQWNRDYTRARMKIDMLLQGQPVGVEWWEDDAVHMLALAERMKDPRFEQLEEWQKMSLESLWMGHYQNWMMKQQGQLPPQLMMGQMGPAPEQAMLQGSQPAQQPGQQQSAPTGKVSPDLSGAEAMYDPQSTNAVDAAAGFE